MKKIYGLFLGAYLWLFSHVTYAAEKFELLPDLPEPLAAAQASSVSTVDPSQTVDTVSHTVGNEPNILTVVFSLIFVIILIYATGIIYAKLNSTGLKALRKQMGEQDNSKATVISTTSLGGNKTLHVVELDGKRMLIGASINGIHLIKDLGSFPPQEIEEGAFSKIEIPNIRIPKIEIPKIEFPNINFKNSFSTHVESEKEKEQEKDNNEKNLENNIIEDEDGFTISDIYEENSDGIIDKLFSSSVENKNKKQDEVVNKNNDNIEHKVDPEEYALYKKYL